MLIVPEVAVVLNAVPVLVVVEESVKPVVVVAV